MNDTEIKRRKAICEAAHVNEIDDVSDGFHTFRQLYYQRMMLFAAIVKQNKGKAWKSLRHEDGELCFGGGWFIVGIDTPEGSFTYHYEDNYFSLFDCEELERGKYWDGHTEKDVTRLLSLSLPQPELCEDAVSRQNVIDAARKVHDIFEGEYDTRTPYGVIFDVQDAVSKLPSVTPKEQRWIPCVDGNEPKANADCWISTNAKYVRRASYAPKTKNQPNGFIVTVGSFGFYEYGKSVKAWMLYEEPEPYKTKENEL